MKALVVHPKSRRTFVTEIPEPELTTSTSVRMRMLEVGVCGTDREIVAFEYGRPPLGDEFLVLGHEALAEVVDVGVDVDDLQVGDLVVPSVRRPCRHSHCGACRSGRQDFCFTGEFTERGINQRHGFMTRLVVDERRYLSVLPSGLRGVGVLVEPLTIVEKALEQVGRIQQRMPWALSLDSGNRSACGYNAVVLGAGPVGLLGALALAESGFRTFVYSRESEDDSRGRIVEAFDSVFLSSQTTTVDELQKRVGGIDVVYEAMGASSLAFDVLRVLGPNGVFVFTGVPGPSQSAPVKTDSIMRNLVLKNQVMLGTVNAGQGAFVSAIARLDRLMQRWPQAVRSLITRRWSLDDAPELLSREVPGIKHIVEIEGD